MIPEERVPAIPKDVVQWLERLFPDKAPKLTDSVDQIRFTSGCVHVVRKLRLEYESQNALEGSK